MDNATQIAQAAINGRGSIQARNWLECSKRKLIQQIARGTFQRGTAIILLKSNARDFAKSNGLVYDRITLYRAAKLICDWGGGLDPESRLFISLRS